MKEIKFIPKMAQGEEKAFDGYVVIRLPSFDERYEALENAGFEESGDGGYEVSGSKFKAMRKLVSETAKLYKEVNLVHIESGAEAKSLDDMLHNSYFDSILVEVATKLMTGFQVGKS